jgi:hypothetical protein
LDSIINAFNFKEAQSGGIFKVRETLASANTEVTFNSGETDRFVSSITIDYSNAKNLYASFFAFGVWGSVTGYTMSTANFSTSISYMRLIPISAAQNSVYLGNQFNFGARAQIDISDKITIALYFYHHYDPYAGHVTMRVNSASTIDYAIA